MRDRDRLESELLELRAVADALDGSLRKLAAGDIYQQIDASFPPSFEGMRKDFNRGLASVGMSIDEILSRTRELRSESAELRHGLQQSAKDERRQSAAVSAAVVALSGAVDTSRSQSAHVDHISAILHNARLDMDRPRQAASRAGDEMHRTCHSLVQLKSLVEDVRSVLREAALLALNGGINAAHTGPTGETALDIAKGLHTLTQQVGTTVEAISEAAGHAMDAAASTVGAIGQLDREFDALGLYLETADTQVQALGETTQQQEGVMQTVRAELSSLGRRADAGETAPHPPQFHLDAIDRAAAEIDRQAGRFGPAGISNPPFPPTPKSGTRSHLRLVKT
jgi:methyl-accepting chemotaxis protein